MLTVSTPNKTMTVIILRSTFLKGKPLEVGKQIVLPRDEAVQLIGAQKAKEVISITAEQKVLLTQEEQRLKEGTMAKPSNHPTIVESKMLKDKAETKARMEAIQDKLVKDNSKDELQQKLKTNNITFESDANKSTLATLLTANGIIE